MKNAEKKWHVLYTKPRCEKKTYNRLIQKGIEAWCPLQKHERQWSDRKKVVEEPLFKSYLFVRICDAEKLLTLQTDGVLNFVQYLGKAAIVRDEEIQLIKSYLLDEENKVSVLSKDAFEADMRIKVSKGVFMDHEGKVVKSAGKNRVFVSLESIGHVMIVEFPIEHLQPVQK